MIPEIFCINLPHRTDRWEKVCDNFRKYDLQINKFDGVYASSLNLPQETRHIWNRDIYHNENSIACATAHLQALKHCESLDGDLFLILEDDAQPCSNFTERFEDGFNELPKNFEFCFLGGSNLHANPSPFSKNISIAIDTNCAVAYMISKKFIKENINFIESNITYNTIDDIYRSMQAKGIKKNNPFYIFNPRIIYQFESYSNILNETVFYPFLKDLD
jgi:GR25 family glycosyltransferase involved in LPS biosynthesis